MGIQLVVGGGHLDHLVANADSKLLAFRHDVGIHYYEYEPRTSPNELLVEDLGVTLLLNLRVDWRPAKTLACSMMTFDLRRLPDKPLEATTDDERGHLAQLIGQLANSPGFGASVATKLLHKKRPTLIPVLDNQAIFGAYMNVDWPAAKACSETVKSTGRIREALEWIHFDLTRRENHTAWSKLAILAPGKTAIEIFDMIWWMHFRGIQPGNPGTQYCF